MDEPTAVAEAAMTTEAGMTALNHDKLPVGQHLGRAKGAQPENAGYRDMKATSRLWGLPRHVLYAAERVAPCKPG